MGGIIARLLPTLAAKIAGGAVIALLLALAVTRIQMGGLNRQIVTLTDENRALVRDLTQCRANTATLQAGIESQNRAVEAQQRASASRITGLEQSLSTARRSAQTAQQQANAILARRPGADQCASALQLIRGN